MDSEILKVLNQDPEKFLHADTRNGIQISVGNLSCKVFRNNIKGGVVVFLPEKALCLSWDRAKKQWLA